MKTPADKTITLTLYSHPTKDLKMRWKAQLAFAPGSTDDTPAKITMVDGEGTPIAEATFEFAGAKTPIRDGVGALRCGDFIKGKHETAIWLHRKGMWPIPGALTFE
ncbi:MAG: hypothetical protein KBT68_05490 [bacterium]|nr:hypothetical protein [Candidatus Colisoma equi]